ncbi:MAG: YjfB family protein [Thermoflexaceae bacterium]|nr:YjfB family protein [Thermoflexaceae bacterium]
MDMSLSALSIGASSMNTDSTVGLAMVKKSLEAIEQNGDSLTRMMEASVTPYLGQNIDYTV